MRTSHAIYSPPKKGLPYVVVTIAANGQITGFTPVPNRSEDRSFELT